MPRLTAECDPISIRRVNAEDLPALNATLNGISTILLVVGYVAIKRDRAANYRLHGWTMASAFVVSTLFLIGYLTHKYTRGEQTTKLTAGMDLGWVKQVYYVILVPHVILAAVMVPMIVMVLLRAYWRQWDKHRRLARWTFPIWLYVSITGVVIYWMLYHLFPRMAGS
jgi:uncharacterized membrane protein YozB (DUF420 family)